MLQKLSYNLLSNCQDTFSTPTNYLLRFFSLDKATKNRRKSFLHWRAYIFLLKILCFQQHLSSWRNDHVACILNVKTPGWPLKIVLWYLPYSIKKEKLVIYFFSLEWLPFFRSLCFQQPVRCYRNDLKTSTVIVRKPSPPLRVVHWGFLHSIKQQRIGQYLFFTAELALFYWIFFVLDNLLGPEGMNL